MKTEYVFGTNINASGNTGIINVKTMNLLCLCDKEDADIILTALSELSRLREENERLQRSIHWALGYTDFGVNHKIRTTEFWWRNQLREMSGLTESALSTIEEKKGGENG